MTIFKIIRFLISIFRVFLVEYKIVALLVLLATNLILINKLYRFLRKTIEIIEAIKSSKLDILDKIVRCKIEKEFRDLEFCCSINSKSIIKSTRLSSCLSIDLVIIK